MGLLLGPLLLRLRARLRLTLGYPGIMGGTASRVRQLGIGLVDESHSIACRRIAAMLVGMVLLRQCLIGCTNDEIRSIASNLQIVVVGVKFGSHSV